MELFFRLFDTGVPGWIWLVTIAVVFVADVCCWMFKKGGSREWIVRSWIAAYLFLILYSTVIGRQPSDHYLYDLTPFWSIGAIEDGFVETFYEKLYNIILFIPFGVLTFGMFFQSSEALGESVTSAERQRVSKGFRRFQLVVLLGLCTSIVVELLQLITKTGMCETDDVICNTIGCAIGAGVVWIGKELVGVVWSGWSGKEYCKVVQ